MIGRYSIQYRLPFKSGRGVAHLAVDITAEWGPKSATCGDRLGNCLAGSAADLSGPTIRLPQGYP